MASIEDVDRGSPRCCGHRMIPIVYGMPGPELAEAELSGEILLGGCVIEPGLPEWRCLRCGGEAGDFGGEWIVGDSLAPRLVTLIREHERLSHGVISWVLEQLRTTGHAALRQRSPSLMALVPTDLLEGEDPFVDLDEIIGELDEVPTDALREIGFTSIQPIVHVLSSVRFHDVTLGLATSTKTDWWYAWLNSNVGDEYYVVVDGPNEPSLERRRAAILQFLDDAPNWISDPGEVGSCMDEDGTDWLRRSQRLDVHDMDPTIDLGTVGR